MVAKILVVSNDLTVRDIVSRYISTQHYQVQSAADTESALANFDQFQPNLVILDDTLVDAASFKLCKFIKHRSNIPVLILTCKKTLQDKRKDFWRVCDDFLTKSFDIFLLELDLRIRTLLSRHLILNIPTAEIRVLTFNNLVIDPISREVILNNQKVELTTLEFDLLYCLANSLGQVWTREDLIRKVWNYQHVGNQRVVDIHIGNIRKKLTVVYPAYSCIKTVKGIGYKFEVPPTSDLETLTQVDRQLA